MDSKEKAGYIILYSTKVDPNWVASDSPLWDLRGLPTKNEEEVYAEDDEEAEEAFKRWKEKIAAKLKDQHRFLVGKPRLVKVVVTELVSM